LLWHRFLPPHHSPADFHETALLDEQATSRGRGRENRHFPGRWAASRQASNQGMSSAGGTCVRFRVGTSPRRRCVSSVSSARARAAGGTGARGRAADGRGESGRNGEWSRWR
jgi:hypothetical protein